MFAKGVFAVLLPVIALHAQWIETRPSPFRVDGGACAGYDPVGGEAWLIQAGDGSSPPTMWRFDDGLWSQRTDAAAQPPTVGATCAWPGHGLLVHGVGTWTWNGAAWTQVVTAHQPPGVFGMDFDPLHGVVVALCAGLETWSFDGVDWQQVATAWPSGGPPVLVARLAWEPITQTVLAAAGMDTSPGLPGFVLYRWNGSAWAMLGSGTRIGFSMTTLPGQGVFFTGGFTFPFTWGPTALWNGSQWSALGAGPASELRASSLSWYDAGRGRLVVTSGLGATPTGFSQQAFGCWCWDGAAWAQPDPGRGPRFADAQVYDSWRGQLLQFGGTYAFGYEHGELWARGDDGLWTRLPGGPAARHFHASAFDSWRGRMVMIGGSHLESGGGSEYLVDADTTWEWDGTAWYAFPSPSPQWSQLDFPVGRIDAAMAFDRARGRCVLFGGRFGADDPLPDVPQNDTWLWDGAAWTMASPAHVPPAVAQPAMWFDEAAGACVLWADGLWSWDGSDWTALATPALPDVLRRIGHDAAREVVVAVVGAIPSPTTYELRAGAWQAVGSTTPAFAGAFDLGRGAFPAVDEVYWSDVGDASAGTIAPFGVGCAGSNGTPVLHGERPFRVGSTRAVRLANGPVGGPWVGVLGRDDDQWAGTPLPLELGMLGAPQCFAYTGIDGTALITAGDWAIVVPAAPQLLGARVRLQAFVFDAAANALGATTSNGVRVRIGS
ncbi:MAG: hypothetical protein H6835_09760 [Planctomycetes bacterium]|nr:hypothetical protein [Planctomycetota bacterium]